jgi:hypothetical protein
MTESTQDPNRNTAEYIKYYCDKTNRHDYAILLNGTWGSGKTYFIKKTLREINQKHLYVSLYGITSTEQIDDAFFRQMHPVLSSKGMRFAAAVGKGLFKTALKIDFDGDGKEDGSVSSSLPDVDLRDYFSDPDESLIVFDDLERCSMSVSDVLGYINSFVEHDGFKSIIIANESEIFKKDELYKSVKEKLIGKTFQIHPSTKNALAYFIGQVRDDKTRDFLIKNSKFIISIYEISKTLNLRTLKQSLWDFERVSKNFTKKHWNNEGATLRLLGQILALSIEIRAGRLNSENFGAISVSSLVRHMRKEKGESDSIIDQIEKKYSNISFDFDVLNQKILEEILINGWHEGRDIASALDTSPHYASPGAEASWRTVWHSFERTESEFYQALDKMESQFKNREFQISGEVLHVIGIRLWLSSAKIIKKKRETVFRENKLYIDDLFKTGKIEKMDRNSFADEFRIQGYGGLGIHENETTDFRELYVHLREMRQKATEANYPQLAASLLSEMKDDQQLFYRRLNLTNSEDNSFYDIPILVHVDIGHFVDALTKLHPSQQRILFMALKARYEHGRLGRELSTERPWLERLRKKLITYSKKKRGIIGYNLQRNVTWNIDEVLK